MKTKVYLVYISIEESVFNSRLKYLVDDVHLYEKNNNTWRGLYAWSYKKKDVTKFLELRNKKIFNVVEKDIDDDYINLMLKNKYDMLKISNNWFISSAKIKRSDIIDGVITDEDKESMTSVYTTKEEYVNSTEFMDENMFEFLPIPDVDYLYFLDSMVEILDILQYTFWYDCHRSVNTSRQDYAAYQESFNLTPCGNKLYVNMDSNELYALLYLYSYAFFGK